MIFKNNFMLTLRLITYKFYSFIGLHSIMHQHNILHIHLHPLNMHVLLQPVPKLLHGPSLVDLPLSLIILLYATSNLPTKIKQLMQPHTNYLVKIPSQIPNTSSNKTILQIPTSIPSVNSLPDWKKKIQKTPARLITDKNPIDLKLKNPVFKPYRVTQTSQAQIQENQTDFLRAIKIHLQNLDRTSLTVPDTPQ